MTDFSRFPSGAMQRILFRFAKPEDQLVCEEVPCESCKERLVKMKDPATGSFFQVLGWARRRVPDHKDVLGTRTYVIFAFCATCLAKSWEVNSIPSSFNGGASPSSVGNRCVPGLM